MNIVICGAGEVGTHAAENLGASGNNITVIDRDPAKLAAIEEVLDVRCLLGDATHASVLREAGAQNADLCIAATNIDEINLLTSSIAKGVGVKTTVARVHHSAYFEDSGFSYSEHFDIDHLVCPELSTAEAIARTLRNPGALAVERFARGRIEIQQLPVEAGSAAAGKALVEIKLPPTTRVGAIERNDLAFIPDARSTIEAGDIITLIGEVDAFEKARKLFVVAPPHRKRIIVMGGSGVGVWVCRALRSKTFSVRLFEADRRRAEELANKLDWVTVLRIDVADPDAFEQERVGSADAFVATTNDDEQNILVAAHAKQMGCPKAVAVLQRGTYLHLLKHVGIDRAFSPRVSAVSEIRDLLDTGPIRHLSSLSVGIADIYEVRVPDGASKVLNKPLKEIAFPSRCSVAAIQRGHGVHVPGADDYIHPHDVAVIIGPEGADRELRKLFNV